MIPWIAPQEPFPPLSRALTEPNGLLAAGADLSVARLLEAYRLGIFPWYGEGEPILWWSPDPRMVLLPAEVRVSRSLAKVLRRNPFHVTADTAFANVIEACRGPRTGQPGTWITTEMKDAYIRLHRAGYAHSIEVWQGDELAGGLYGVAIGRAFFGESMFTRTTDASKVALVALARQLQRWAFGLIDCQMKTAHLESLGATEIPRDDFARRIAKLVDYPSMTGPWRIDGKLTT
ncbi:MAG TPA: leucyl/phenylalanyl-tRNA--protein transferase [Burkholderiales bacterium]|nr:leucyl/phenylalanyl-tRNA--protein transferase [Burkholderiales bacterium]